MKSLIPAVTAVTVIALAGAAQASPNLIANGSFEQPAVSSPGFTYPASTVDSWDYQGDAVLINEANGDWGSPANADGQQFAGLQTTGTLSQDFNVSSAGSYTLTWLDAGRSRTAGGDQTYDVMLDGAQVGSYATTSAGTDFTAESLKLGPLSTGGHTLEFVGTDLNGGDNTAFLDNVSIATGAVPEPATWAMMMLGMGALGAVARRRKGIALAS